MPTVFLTTGWLRAFAILGTFVLVILALRYAEEFFVIVALAILLAFVLQPSVAGLQRRGLRRTVAVLLTVTVVFSAIGGLGWLFVSQMSSQIEKWPEYRVRIEKKIVALEHWRNGDATEASSEAAAADDGLRPPEAAPGSILEKFRNLGSYVQEIVVGAIKPVMELLLSSVFVIVLVVFMLLRREDLRNRLIRLLGQDRRTIITTKALDEAAQRISRFLLMQVMINFGFGLCLGVGLFFIGLPFAPLWGFLAALMRFIPYVGTWVGLIVPVIFSLATGETGAAAWQLPLEVIVLFMVLELVTANVLEPLLFGYSVGVSPVALLVAAIFWAWLWGPLGLILSTPLTVCLFVVGKYVPPLNFLEILLGDEPPLEASVNYYQRLLAHDLDEATDVLEEQFQQHSLDEVFDTVLIPALVQTKRDREQGDLAEADEQYILQSTRDLVNNLGYFESLVAKPVPPAGTAPATAPLNDGLPRVKIQGLPAADEFDELALLMFRHLLEPAGVDLEITSAKLLSSEAMAHIEQERAPLALIVSLPEGGGAQARYLCKRLRSRFADLKIFVARWGLKENVDGIRKRLQAAGADLMFTTLAETRSHILPLAQSLAHVKETPEASSDQRLAVSGQQSAIG